MKRIRSLTAVLAALALLAGCKPAPTSKAPGAVKPAVGGGDHAHGAGPHGGSVADWGGGKYHVEFMPDHGKKEATVWVLDSDEVTPVPIKAKDGELSARLKGLKTGDEFQFVLKADPQQGDSEGKASRFVGKHEKLGVEQEFEGTISGEADGTPYKGNFKEEPEKK